MQSSRNSEDITVKIDSPSYVHNGMVMQWGQIISEPENIL